MAKLSFEEAQARMGNTINPVGPGMSPAKGKIAFKAALETHGTFEGDTNQASWKNYVWGMGDAAIDLYKVAQWADSVSPRPKLSNIWADPKNAWKEIPVVKAGLAAWNRIENVFSDPEPTNIFEEEQVQDPYMQPGARGNLNTLAGAFGIDQPRGRYAETQADVGRNIVYSAPIIAATAAGAGPAIAPYVLGGEAIGTVAGPFLNRATRESLAAIQGKNPTMAQQVGQAVAGTGAEILASGVAPALVAKGGAASIAFANKETAKKLLARAPKKMQREIFDLTDELNKALTQRFGPGAPTITPEMVVEHTQDLKYLFQPSVRNGGDVLPEALKYFDEAAKFPKGARPRPMQSVPNRLSRDILGQYEEGLADIGPMRDYFVREAGYQHEAFIGEIVERFSKVMPEGSADDFVAFYRGNVRRLKADADKLWRGLDAADEFMLRPYDDEVMDILARAEGTEELLPKEVRQWANSLEGGVDPEEVWSITRVQNIRSKMLDLERASDITDPLASKKALWAGEFRRKVLDPMIDSMPDEPRNARAAARAATRKWKELTDPDVAGGDVASVLLKEAGAEEGIPKAILKSREHMRRAMDVVGNDPDAIKSLQNMVYTEIFGVRSAEGLKGTLLSDDVVGVGKKTPTQIREFIYKHQRPLRELLGDERVDGALLIADWIEQAKRGRIATRGAFTSTGSAKQPRGTVIARPDLMKSPMALANKALQELLASVQDDSVRVAMMQEAFLDPELMGRLLRIPSKAAIPAYVLEWSKLIQRAGARSAAIGARAPGAGETIPDELFDEAEAVLSRQLGVSPQEVPDEKVVEYILERLD